MPEGQTQDIRPFYDFLREHRAGLTGQEAGKGLNDLVAAVVDTGKAGTLTITFKIKPLGRDKGDGLEVSADVVVKSPTLPKGVSIFYPTPNNNLQRQDPRQADLPLREVGPGLAHRGVA